MKKLLLIFLALVSPCFAVTYNITTATPLSTIQADLTAASGVSGVTFNFAAGTYEQFTSAVTFPCNAGQQYLGPSVPFVVGTGVSPTAILDATAGTPLASPMFNLASVGTFTSAGAGCVFKYLNFHGGVVYASNPSSGALFEFDKFDDLVDEIQTGCANCAGAVFLDGGASSTDVSYDSFLWNTFGPGCYLVNQQPDNTNYQGQCAGIWVNGSSTNLIVENNNVSGQIEEFLKFWFIGQNGAGSGTNANLLVEYNDIGYVHRIGVENQNGDVSNAVVQFNSFHDPYLPIYGSMGFSFACCTATSGSAFNADNVSNNVIIFNTACLTGVSYCPGFGIELWGNGPIANANLIQVNGTGNSDIDVSAPGGSNTTTSPTVQYNVIQSTPSTGFQIGVICGLGGTTNPPACTGVTGTQVYSPNTVSTTTISPVNSIAPGVYPPSGTYSTSQTVIVTQGGTNHSTWCTTDGSLPVPGSGSSFLYTAPFLVSVTGTRIVKCVGMWGTGANPYSYASGYGYVPSSATTVTYSYTNPAPAPQANKSSGFQVVE